MWFNSFQVFNNDSVSQINVLLPGEKKHMIGSKKAMLHPSATMDLETLVENSTPLQQNWAFSF